MHAVTYSDTCSTVTFPVAKLSDLDKHMGKVIVIRHLFTYGCDIIIVLGMLPMLVNISILRYRCWDWRPVY